MEIKYTSINGLYIIENTRFIDDRGSFAELFNAGTLKSLGIDFTVAQINHATNDQSSVLRGLHFQKGNAAQAKIVKCIKGKVIDCAVDIDRTSRTFGKHFLYELSEESDEVLYIPEGLAHGYLTLTAGAEVIYLTSKFYDKKSEAGIRYNDPFFSIKWPKVDNLVVSERDASWPDFV